MISVNIRIIRVQFCEVVRDIELTGEVQWPEVMAVIESEFPEFWDNEYMWDTDRIYVDDAWIEP